MARPKRAFDDHRGPTRLRSIPTTTADDPPYESINSGEMPPMMFQVKLADGQWLAFSYGDVRQIHRRDAGKFQITVLALTPLCIDVEGRNLDELVNLLGMGRVRWLREADPRSPASNEGSLEINRISIDAVQTQSA